MSVFTMLVTRTKEASSRSASPSSAVRNTSWADGLRGLASLFVVSSHTVLSFAPHLILPCSGENGPAELFQRPIFRLISQGRAWVAVFFVLLGFVNSLKAIKQSRAGAVDEALSTLATSSFRRTGRLVFPAAAVTVLTWFACQIRFMNLALNSESYWLRISSVEPSESWVLAIDSLIKQLISTWFFSDNKYDQPQWALSYLFKASMYVFMVLLATINTTPRFRLLAEVALYIWSWSTGDCLVGLNVFAGMILAEISMYPLPQKNSGLVAILPYPLALLGLYFCSYPDEYNDWAPWSRQLLRLGTKIFPLNSDFGRFWPGLGAQILCFSILFSPPLRRALSHKYLLWLGSVSYPIYLLHGPLMRTVLAWITFAPIAMHFEPAAGEDGQNQRLPLPRPLAFVFILPVFWAFLLYVVHLWALKVEPLVALATKKFEDFAKGNGGRGRERSPRLLPLQKERSPDP